jgi:dipeptidyl aminopeptidase/acylaminoacyl peptidase
MNNLLLSLFMAAILLSSGCSRQGEQGNSEARIIGRPEINTEKGVLTPEILYSLNRVGDPKLSPDGSKVLFGVTFTSIEENKGNRELFTVNIDGSDKKQITRTAQSESNAVWMKSGNEIAFLSTQGGSSQIWIMNSDGTNRRQVSSYDGDIEGFLFSPDETRILFFAAIKYGQRTVDIFPNLPKATGRIVDDLMYKHWDEWVETIPHPFVASFDNGKMGAAKDIMANEPYESPMKPYTDLADLAWSHDSKQIAYASRKKTGIQYSLSTNSDIYIYNIETDKTHNLTEGMMGYDTAPSFSPDGKYIAWISQERDGYESDKKRLFIADLQTGEKTYLTDNFDYETDAIQWLPDSRALYFVACKEALVHIWQIDLDKNIRQITSGQYNYGDIHTVDGKIVATRQSHEYPAEIYIINPQTGDAREISLENKSTFDRLAIARSEPRWIKTTDSKQMLTWIVYPPHFDPNKKYPALLYCQGGPQSSVSQFWSYRWNLQLMAASGYIIIAPNRRGVPGFGQEWVEQISGDYGGQNMKDYLAAIDEIAREPYIDAARLGAVGASYGGYSVYWLAGNHEQRFKAFVAHAGMFNFEQQYLETEEMWFENWDLGGAFWDKSNPKIQNSYAASPHRFVDRWDTPILVTHGEKDYRVPVSQGYAAFNAAKLRGLPAEMLIFPDENHWIAKPQNGLLFQYVFFRWLDKWLK